MDGPIPPVAPSIVLSLLVGALWTCVYVLVRGRLRLHVLLVLPAAVAGAWAGQALGARLGDPTRLGDYPVVSASLVACVGIVVVAVAATIGARAPDRRVPDRDGQGPGSGAAAGPGRQDGQ